ncbi:MAG: PDZ domain-containing protein, partial [Rhodobacteraceae bacterium]|nr:PDZ domain-containing protein [Paracoccaceae bacterium]
ELGSADTGGAVTSVALDSPASEQGIRPGDVIVSVNQTEAKDSETVAEVIATAKENDRDSVLLLLERDGARRFLTLSLTRA